MNAAHLVIMCVVLTSCGGIVVLDDLPQGNNDGRTVDAGAGGIELDGGIDSDSDAGYDASLSETCESPVPGAFTCCDGTPCRGICNSNWGCVCGAVLGGCQNPTICCLNTGACTSTQVCP